MDNKVFFVPHTNWVSQGSGTNLKTKEIPCLTGKGKPTAETAGAVGCWYMDTDSGTVYKCTAAADGVYTWIDLVNSDELRCIVEAYLQENPPEDGADGGHYTPVITQPTADTMKVEFLPSRAGMAAVEPVEIKLPVGSGNDSGQNVDLTGYAKEQWVQEGFQPKGNYLTTAPVESINGKTGKVVLSAADVGARPNTWTPTAQEVGALPNTYTPPNQTAEQVGADPKGTAAGAVSAHNVNGGAHNDIRQELAAINARLTAFFDSDNQTLDEMSEIVAYITSNKSLIDAITTSKVSVADIIDNLATSVANKPLSAAQGVAIKALIDGLASGKLDASKLPEAINTALAQAKASGAFDGAKGDPGRGIKSIARTSGNGAAGTTDTYTITYTDNTTGTFQVRNGSNGAAGKATTLEITDVTALAPGAAPTVTEQSGSTAQARRYILGIPQGAPGYTPQRGVDYWSPEDQEAIVQQVVDSLGGTLLGSVDSEHNIVLTGALPDGTYTLKYENADGTVTEIGTIEVGEKMPASGYAELSWYDGVKLDKTNGTEGSSTGYCASSHVEIVEGYTYTAKQTMYDGSRYGGVNAVFYDANGNFVSCTELWASDSAEHSVVLTPPTGAASFRLRVYYGSAYKPGMWPVYFEKSA